MDVTPKSRVGFRNKSSNVYLKNPPRLLVRSIRIKVNTKIARQMLELAGYWDADKKSDEEIFELVMRAIECYGATYKEIKS